MFEIPCLLDIDIEVAPRLFAFPRDDWIPFGDGECGELVDKKSAEMKILVEIRRGYFAVKEVVEGCLSLLLELLELVHSVHYYIHF